MWIDRYYYKLSHLDMPEDDDWLIAFCPEGYYKVGDVIKDGDFTRTVVKVVPRIREANIYLDTLWREKLKNERPKKN